MARKSKKIVERKLMVNDAITEGCGILTSLHDEISEVCDNLEEKFSNTSRYDTLCSTRDTLSSITDEFEVDEFANKEITFTWKTKRRASRSYQRDEAVALLQAAAEALSALKEVLEEENTAMAHDDEIAALDEWVTDLESKISDAESVDFPGMFG